MTTSASSGERKATQSFLPSAIAMSWSATVAEASPPTSNPISTSSASLNLLNAVILSPSEGAEPSTPPDKLVVSTIEPSVAAD